MSLRLVAILQTDCPTCRLITPYLNTLAKLAMPITAISQDDENATREFVRQMEIPFPVERDPGFEIARRFEVVTVPTLYVVDEQDRVVRQEPGFDKKALNEIAALFGHAAVASPNDGAPESKPGCSSRHLEVHTDDPAAAPLDLQSTRGNRASIADLADGEDPFEYCYRTFGDALPV